MVVESFNIPMGKTENTYSYTIHRNNFYVDYRPYCEKLNNATSRGYRRLYTYGFLLGKNFLSVAEENTNP